MKKIPIEESGLTPDRDNANAGTQRGRGLLEKSLRKLGAGRSVLADKNGNIIAGNKTLEGAAEINLPVRIVETDGTELVVVKRTDLDLYSETDKRGRQLAYADNKVAELDLSWKPEQVAADFAPLELGEWGFPSPEPFDPMKEWRGMPEFEQEDLSPTKQITVSFASIEDYENFSKLINQKLTEKTRSIWYPEAKKINMTDVYKNES